MIIEYEDKYLEDIRDLLVELEEHIVSIDIDELDQVGENYREQMALVDLKEVEENDGKTYLYVENGKAIGLIMGVIRDYDPVDYLDYKCPKAGRVTELVVSKNARSGGIGKQLMNKMEEYFKSKDCEWMFVEVFGYNDRAIKFYEREGYHTRMYDMLKKVK